MLNRKAWSLGVLLATMVLLLTGVLNPTLADAPEALLSVRATTASDTNENDWPPGCAPADSSTPGENGYTAPAPCKIDASGTDSDQYCIPLDSFYRSGFGFGMYYVNDKPKGADCYPTKGAKSITITTDFESGAWKFDYTDKDQGKEAENLYGAERGMCNPDVGRWSVTAWINNKDDKTDLPIKKLTVIPDRPKGPIPVTYSEEKEIQDGETREIPIMDFQGGLPPGTWNLNFYIGHVPSDKVPTARAVLWVPSCGDEEPPAGDHPPDQKAKPKASIRQLMCHPRKVRVTFNNRASGRAVVFRLIKNGKPLKPYKVEAGKLKRVTVKAKPGNTVKVDAQGKILAAKRIKPYRRC